MAQGYGTQAALAGLVEGFEQVPAWLRRSVTFDQGSEWALWGDLTATYGLDAWFCDPVRHEALLNPAVMKGHGHQPVAAD